MLFIKQKYKQQCCFLAHKGGWFSKISNTRQPIRNTHAHINKEWTNEGAGFEDTKSLSAALLSFRVYTAVCERASERNHKCRKAHASASCLKCVACRLWRLTQNHSVEDTLSLTKSSAKQERKKSVTLGVKTLCRIFYHLHVYLMSISPLRVCDWTNKQSRSWVCKSTWDHQCCYC